MNGFRVGDKVTTTFTGDVVWVVRNLDPFRQIVLDGPADQFRPRLHVDMGQVRVVRMQEPTELGAVVMTDEGEAVRFTRTASFKANNSWHLPGAFRSLNRTWPELVNPRPVGAQ